MAEEHAEWIGSFNPFPSYEEFVSGPGSSGGETTVKVEMDRISSFFVKNWPLMKAWLVKISGICRRVSVLLVGCSHRGLKSLLRLNSAAYFLLLWCSLLSMTGITCLFYAFMGSGIVCLAGPVLGLASVVFGIAILGATLLWIYGSIWLTSILLLIAGGIFKLKHTKLAILIATAYSIYCAKVRGGWHGLGLCMILACMSNDIFIYLSCAIPSDTDTKSGNTQPDNCQKETSSDRYQSSENGSEHIKDSKSRPSESNTEENGSAENTCESSTKFDKTSPSVSISDEVPYILESSDYYEMFGYSRYQKIDLTHLKRVYKKKAMLVHPDKNMGNSMSEEAFKKLQVAYEILSDLAKKRQYDEQLRKEEHKRLRQNCQCSSQNVASSSPHIHQTSIRVRTAMGRKNFMRNQNGMSYGYAYSSVFTNFDEYALEEEFFIWAQNIMSRGDVNFPDFVLDGFRRHQFYNSSHR